MNTSTNAVMTSDVAVESPVKSLSFSIPPQDEEFFATQLPFTVQKEIRRLLGLCNIIHRTARGGRAQAPSPGGEGQGEGGRSSVMAICRRLAAQHSALGRGYSASSLRTKYYNYVRTGDWRSMWNKAKAPPVADRKVLPPKFVQFVKQLAEDNQRKIAPAIENLYHIYRTGFDLNGKEYTAIPGYESGYGVPASAGQRPGFPEPDDFTGLPVGWSYANLQRKVNGLFLLTAARIGRSAARQHALKVYSSRVDVACGEYILFDDHEFNLKINFPGQRRAMRPKGFCAMDLLSACCISKSFKPTLWDEANGKKQVLTERDFMWFVVDLLCRIGHRTDKRGTALIVEWGTAAIRSEFEQRIHDATRGLVRVERSGKFGEAAHIGQAEGRTTGNFRFKALIESFFGPLDNLVACLPGQVGKDRNHSPEQLHGLEKENNRLLEALAQIESGYGVPASAGQAGAVCKDLATALQFPFLSWQQFLERVLPIFDLLDSRTHHKLQGWAKLGFVTNEWRVGNQPWLPQIAFEQLPAEEKSVVRALIERGGPHASVRSRQLSPHEVFEMRKSELRPLPLFKLPELLGPEFARELSVRAGEFTFDDQEIDSDPLRFMAVDTGRGRIPSPGGEGQGEGGRSGTRLSGKYQCYVNPFNPSHLVACDAENRVIGICQRIIPPSRNDIDGIKRAMGQARAWETEALAELNARHIDTARENVARRAHNAAVIERSSRGNEAHSEGRATGPSGAAPAAESQISNLKSEIPSEEPETYDLR